MSAAVLKSNAPIPSRIQPAEESSQRVETQPTQPRKNSVATKQQPPQVVQMKPTTQLESKSKKAPNGRRSGKPFINWFQKKLAGTVKVKRSETGVLTAGDKPRNGVASRTSQRATSSPFPPSATLGRQHGRQAEAASKRKTISLNGDDDGRDYFPQTDDEELSLDRSSTWSPNSAQLEADEDASVRPLPPSSPPSPSPSRSSSSYLSDPRTFRSIAASTKPTTLLSIDLNGGGMAHIAQAPVNYSSPVNRFPHIRSSSQATGPPSLTTSAAVTFSALQPSNSTSSRPASLRIPTSITQQSSVASGPLVHAPLHTAHHPRNNPRPSSPPLDNASMLTLASSAYAIPGQRPGISNSAPPSAVLGGGDSLSHFGGGSLGFADAESTSQLIMGEDERLDERDFDASVRALRPRSSRRGSWESEASRWSARIQPGPGTPSLARERSVWTTNSIRTGAFSVENAEPEEEEPEQIGSDENTQVDENQSPESIQLPSQSESTSLFAPSTVENPPPSSSDQDPLPSNNEPAKDTAVTPDPVAPADSTVSEESKLH
ncbi:hypothetical protein ONZ45_g19 [Pleurotus djamor]|nr:hypothetical protein ONZ45_g19 [Pleurotus djamor]